MESSSILLTVRLAEEHLTERRGKGARGIGRGPRILSWLVGERKVDRLTVSDDGKNSNNDDNLYEGDNEAAKVSRVSFVYRERMRKISRRCKRKGTDENNERMVINVHRVIMKQGKVSRISFVYKERKEEEFKDSGM